MRQGDDRTIAAGAVRRSGEDLIGHGECLGERRSGEVDVIGRPHADGAGQKRKRNNDSGERDAEKARSHEASLPRGHQGPTRPRTRVSCSAS